MRSHRRTRAGVLKNIRRIFISMAFLFAVKFTKLKMLRQREGRKWTEEYNTPEMRAKHSQFYTLMENARLANHTTFFKFTRLYPEQFEYVVQKVGHLISHRDTNYRDAITVGKCERVSVTLRFLATGESCQSLSFAFRMGKSTVHSIVNQTCRAIFTALSEDHLRVPNKEQWATIASDFGRYWNFPNCIGALDGKHVRIEAPDKAGSRYFNYKGYHSIVLMAMCDARYRFTVIDVGACGREGDAAIFASSELAVALENNTLQLPAPKRLPNSTKVLPHVIVGDDAFPLKPYLLKPFPGRGNGTLSLPKLIFNYRLSRARRIIENAFGIFSTRWRIFKTEIAAKPKNIDMYIKAAVVLHNFIIENNCNMYSPPAYIKNLNEKDRAILDNLEHRNLGRTTFNACTVRETFMDYFVCEDILPWQLELVTYDGYVSP